MDELPALLLVEVAHKIGNVPETHGGALQKWKNFSADKAYPQLQAAAQTFLGLPPRDRLAALDVVLENSHRGKLVDHLWIASPAAQQIAQIMEGVSSVRCAFGWSLHPALQIGVAAAEAGDEVDLCFVDQNPEVCDMAALAAVSLEVTMSVFLGQPFERLDGVKAEAEISLPPFGWKMDKAAALPRETLEWLGAMQSGRLTSEPVAIADILAHAPQAQAIIGVSAGPLFRMVGVEVAARDELINAGRLQAVFDVPSGMIYHETGIATALLVMSPVGEKRDIVRFTDLSDPHFASRSSRGRYEARLDVTWAEMLSNSALEVDYARDVPVPEIEEQDRILTPSRYLSRTAAKLSAFNDRYEVKELSEIVELIRPVALPKDEDGEYLVHETAPSDVGEDGFLTEPPKIIKVGRGGLRKARNQQLEPGDVVISVKGTIGRVGLVPDDVPDRNADTFWTVGQSMMILRPRRGGMLPEALYEYLSSELMHEHLNTLAGGAVIQAFNMKDLKSLPIPVPTMEEQAKIREEFAKRQDAFRELERLRQEIGAMKAKSWPHRDLPPLNSAD
ncbi:restriction endonuclease subunit S [Roseovarius bejariae]|nr:restriction endonuclease subunit S [Roseovarius bejariae]